MAVQQEKHHEMPIFIDVFHRADKNDDGMISWEEFKSFFADGVLSAEELRKLFDDMDTHNTNNIDTGELCTYFGQHLGAFKDVFYAIQNLNDAVSKTLHQSAEEYPKSDLLQQFMSRFLMRELVHQVTAAQQVLDAASDSIDEMAQAQRACGNDGGAIPQMSAAEASPVDSGKKRVVDGDGETVDPATILPGRYARRARRQLSTQTSWQLEAGGAPSLVQQVDRLRSLVDRLENKVNFEGITDEQVDIKNEELMIIVRRKLVVADQHDKAFRSSLRQYIEAANTAGGCLHLGVRSYAESNVFVVYEIWEDNASWTSHIASKTHKGFQHNNIDHLEQPEQVTTMPLPKNWWKKE